MRIGGEHPICMFGFLYFPQHGLLVTGIECLDGEPEEGNLLPDTPVNMLRFVEVTANAEEMLQSLQHVQGIELEEIPLNWVDWNGYGHYEPSE